MKRNDATHVLQGIFIGGRYRGLAAKDQARYVAANFAIMLAIIPLAAFGVLAIGVDPSRMAVDFALAGILLVCLVSLRSGFPLKTIALVITPLFGAYCLHLLSRGAPFFWTAVWIFSFPLIAVFLCEPASGIFQSGLVLLASVFLMYSPFHSIGMAPEIRLRFIGGYAFIFALAIVHERAGLLKDKNEARLNAELAHERETSRAIKDNIPQGIFLMDRNLRILPGYSEPLVSILASGEAELAGRSFADIFGAALDAQRLNAAKGYIAMIFFNAKSKTVLESANPVSEFEYPAEGGKKTLGARFRLVERANAEPAIMAIVQDISGERERGRELRLQKEAHEREMKNAFDALRIAPLAFEDFIEDAEAGFNRIKEALKDENASAKRAGGVFFRNIREIKSDALELGLENFGEKLHELEDRVKALLSRETVKAGDILALAPELERMAREKDEYAALVKKARPPGLTHQVDAVLLHSLARAVEKASAETRKRVELKAGPVDIGILESKLRKPIKDILLQCAKNSIYHGIEPANVRMRKNKKPLGLLAFSIRNVDGNAEITFSDDGSGLDWEKIKARYVELYPENKVIAKRTLLASLFSPEFSAEEEAFFAAKRGAGLSQVRNLVKENRGSIKVDSSGSGLTMKFTFPLAAPGTAQTPPATV